MSDEQHGDDAPTQVQPDRGDDAVTETASAATETAAATASAADGAPAANPWEASRGRRIGVRALIALAALIGVLSIFAVWSSQQLLNTDQWTKTSSQMLQDPQVRDQVATYLTDQLYANVNVAGELQNQLPDVLKPLAPAASAALRNAVDEFARKALANPAVQSAWADANRVAHEQFVKVIDGGGPNVSTTGGEVKLNLSNILTVIAQRVGIPQSLVSQIPPDAATITVLKSKQLQTAQDLAKLLKTLAWVLGPLALLLLALAVYLAPGHRRQTLLTAGFAAIAVGLLVLLVRGIVGTEVTSALVKQASLRPAVNDVWTISTDLMKTLAWQAIIIGAALALAAWVAGPSSWATSVRRGLAPVLRERQEIAYGVLAAILLLLIVWSPTPGFHRPIFVLLLLIAAPLGLWALRRETLVEFPDAGTGDGSTVGLRERASAAAASARESVSGVRHKHDAPAEDEATTRMAKLERLSALRDGGALTDEEFAAEKAKVLADDGAAAP